jgi:hypothetical protein
MVDNEFRSDRDRDLLAPQQTSRGGIGDLLAELAQLAEQWAVGLRATQQRPPKPVSTFTSGQVRIVLLPGPFDR